MVGPYWQHHPGPAGTQGSAHTSALHLPSLAETGGFELLFVQLYFHFFKVNFHIQMFISETSFMKPTRME